MTFLCSSSCRKSQQSLTWRSTQSCVPPQLSRQEQTNRAAAMSVLSISNPPGWSVCSALCLLIVLLPEAKADNLNTTTQRNGGGSQCGEYTNQVITVNILATHQCDVFWRSCCRRDFCFLLLVQRVCQLCERASLLCRDQNNVSFPATVTVLQKQHHECSALLEIHH